MKTAFLLVALSCVAMCLAEDNVCTHNDALKVTEMWESVWSAQNSEQVRVELGEEVFEYIFKKSPAAKQLFTRVNVADVNSPEFQAHVVRVINGLDILINFLDDRPSLEAAAEHLADQHAVRAGVTGAAFQLMDDAFVELLPQVVDNFNPDTWQRCWHSAVDIITAALS